MAHAVATDRRLDTAGTLAANGSSSRVGRVLGVDPGLDRTGYAIVDGSKGRVVEAGLIRTDRRQPLARRLVDIGQGLSEIFNEHGVDLVAVEELYAHYKHPRTAILMGHARGVVLLTAAQHGVAVESYSATMIKRRLTGNGHAGKGQVQRAIMATLGLARLPEPADVADALAAAFCSLHSRRGGSVR